MQLLPLLQEGIILGETLECQLLSNLDVLRLWHVPLLERADLHGVGCAKESYLAVIRHHLKDLLDDLLEFSRNQFINLVKNAELALVEFGVATRCQIKNSSRCCNDDVHILAHSDDILVDSGATRRHHALHLLVLADLLDDK